VKIAARNLNITDPAVLARLHTMAAGVSKLFPTQGMRDHADDGASVMASMRRRAVNRSRTTLSLSQDSDIPVGKRWGIDVEMWALPTMDGHVGFVYGTEFCTRYTVVLHLRRKNTDAILEAIKKLQVLVYTHHPNVGTLELTGDCDTSWTVAGRGPHDRLPQTLLDYFSAAPPQGPILFRRSAPNTHQQNFAESEVGVFFQKLWANVYRSNLQPRP
jgi:hypothetical protein